MTYLVSQFQISDENLLLFKRFVKKPMDCVINALEILFILEHNSADLMRIVVGDQGITIEQIENIFKYVNPQHRFRFFRYTNIETLSRFCQAELVPGHVIFCGYNMQGFKHVFLIGKNFDGSVMYIDPQQDAFCDLSSEECYGYIKDAEEYYILQSTMSLKQIQQQQKRAMQVQMQNQL